MRNQKSLIVFVLSKASVLFLMLILLNSYVLMFFTIFAIIAYNILLHRKILKNFLPIYKEVEIIFKSDEETRQLFSWMVSDSICWQSNCKVRDRMIIFMSNLLQFWNSIDWHTSLRTALVYDFWFMLLRNISKDKFILLENRYIYGLLVAALKMVVMLSLIVVLYNSGKQIP